MNERELVGYLRSHLPRPSNLQNWMDEDCEIITLGDKILLASLDTSSEKADFPSEAPAYETGYFCTALSLSDIAACGGKPLGILVSCSIPPNFRDNLINLYEGVQQAALDAGTFVLGGDTNSAGELSLSVVSLGEASPKELLRRGRARVGDIIGVTGELDKFNFGYYQYVQKELIDFTRMLCQPASIRADRLLAELGVISSCIDLPDGLIKTLRDNSREELGCLIYDELVPVSHFRTHAHHLPDTYNYVLASKPAGDLQLLFTVPEKRTPLVEDAFKNQQLALHWIGIVTDQGKIKVKANDLTITPTEEGFVHKFDGYKLFN